MLPRKQRASGRPNASELRHQKWARKTLVVGPSKPIDGDSVACVKAIINHLRKQGKEAYTLPTPVMYAQLAWILSPDDYHPAGITGGLTTDDLQKAYDAVIASWRPDEIILVDGQLPLLGFDPRGVPVYTIDHHTHKGTQDDKDGFIQEAPSAGCLLIKNFGIFDAILVVSILTDTFWLRQHMPAQAACYLAKLVEHGCLTDDLLIDIQHKLMVRKDPHIVEALREGTMRISKSRKTVFVVLMEANPEIHRGAMGELGYFFDNICCVRGDGYVSFKLYERSKELPKLAIKYGGGGHEDVAGGQLASSSDWDVNNRLEQDFLRVAEPSA